jgi:predicted permease
MEHDLEREVRLHIELETEQNIRRGMTPEDAARKARIAFGGVDAHMEAVRDEHPLHLLDTLAQDLRYALRQIRRSPAFALTAVLVLSLGIGAATAVTTIVEHVLHRSLPYPDADRIVFVTEAGDKGDPMLTSWPNFADWREQARTVSRLSAFMTTPNDPMVVGGQPLRGSIQYVSADFFGLFGVAPVAGRVLRADENVPGGPQVAVISERLWRNYLASHPLDGTVTLNLLGAIYSVVGVLPAGFHVLDAADVWLGAGQGPVQVRGAGNYWVAGRLGPAASVQSAGRELDAIAGQLKKIHGDESVSSSVVITPLLDRVVAGARQPLLALLGAALFVLVVTAASIAMMQLARGASRDREMLIRTSLGASRSRIGRQLFTEQLVLAVMGCTGGIAIAAASVGAIRRYGAGLVPRLEEVRVDGWALLGALVMTALAAVLFGLVPMLRLIRRPVIGASAMAQARRSGGKLSVLVSVQAAVAVLLLTGASLLVTSLYRVLTVDLGYDRHGVVSVTVPLNGDRYNDLSQRIAMADRLRHSLGEIPGAGTVALSSQLPYQRGGNRGPILVPPFGDPNAQSSWASIATLRVVSENYFSVMGVPLLRGRMLGASDGPGTKSVVINRALAQKLWPGVDPLGRQLRALADQRGDTLTVVGVVADARDWRSADGSQQEIYLTIDELPQIAWQLNAVYRPSVDPVSTMAEAARKVRSLDPDIAPDIRTLDAAITESIADRRFIGGVVLVFAAVVLMLTIAGVFGSVAYAVERRTREIGIRMAIGATRREVWLLVQRGVLASALIGGAIGIVLSLESSRLLNSLLYGIGPRDPVALAVSMGLVGVAVAAAASIPALRATRIDPAIAMKSE